MCTGWAEAHILSSAGKGDNIYRTKTGKIPQTRVLNPLQWIKFTWNGVKVLQQESSAEKTIPD